MTYMILLLTYRLKINAPKLDRCLFETLQNLHYLKILKVLQKFIFINDKIYKLGILFLF